jgi:hypothetical protein
MTSRLLGRRYEIHRYIGKENLQYGAQKARVLHLCRCALVAYMRSFELRA